jgi:hypothetical protein
VANDVSDESDAVTCYHEDGIIKSLRNVGNNHEDAIRRFLRNVGNHSQVYTVITPTTD